MTLCIGAHALDGQSKCIVLCCDSKVASDVFGSETEVKAYRLSPYVVALAVDRPSRAKELAVLYETHLLGVTLSYANLLDTLREPVRRLKERIANTYVSKRLGVSYREFLLHGAQWFGQPTVDKYVNDIESHSVGVEMIISGFIGISPFLCDLRDGEVNPVTNFSLLGTGAYTAEPILHARGQCVGTSLAESVYNIYEAKKLGENSPFVGKETKLFVLRPGNSQTDIKVLSKYGKQILEKQWRRFGIKKVPRLTDLPTGAFEDIHSG